MDQPAPLPVERDPEFRPPPSVVRLLDEQRLEPHEYLRLVANPFLAVLAFLVWWGVADRVPASLSLFRGPGAPLASILAVGLLGLLPRLFQVHCLDCGSTEWLGRWRRHNCPASALRRRSGRPRRLRGPTPTTQVALWLLALLLLWLFAFRPGAWPGRG